MIVTRYAMNGTMRIATTSERRWTPKTPSDMAAKMEPTDETAYTPKIRPKATSPITGLGGGETTRKPIQTARTQAGDKHGGEWRCPALARCKVFCSLVSYMWQIAIGFLIRRACARIIMRAIGHFDFPIPR